MPYASISDYGAIGDCHTAALVSSEGSIDWCCLPHFDSDAVFCRILDYSRGGYFSLRPAGPFRSSRQYEPDSNILVTTFEAPGGAIRVIDCMPIEHATGGRRGSDVRTRHEILRTVEGLAGRVKVRLEFKPTFGFAAAVTTLEKTGEGCVARTDGGVLSLRTPDPGGLQIRDDRVAVVEFTVAEGERRWIDANYVPRRGIDLPQSLTRDQAQAALARTREYWRRWSSLCSYDGPYRNLVLRSALTLKLLTFEPTGAIVAAPTTSLPEQIGGERNWDYRYTWLRDSALTLYALESVGYIEEAMDYWDWLERIPHGTDRPLPIMFTLEGTPLDGERELPHLEGYRGSRPVRVGNHASTQLQLDVFGEILDAAYLCTTRIKRPSQDLWPVLASLADRAAQRWKEPDQGLWEVRTGPRHFVYSKLLCWVALDRAVSLARTYQLAGSVDRWSRERDQIRSAILRHGYDEGLGAFAQAFDHAALDASALAIPLVGFLPATDPRMRSTIRAIRERLTANGLVYRYRVDDAYDGIGGSEATFAMCTFWLVDNLALLGQKDEAAQMFERVVSYANDLGLFAEEIQAHTRDLLGNFPQGFTHLALIRSAVCLQPGAVPPAAAHIQE
jgi:GH15 family glucan-1,4-alpha-glucosidase